MTAKNQGHKDGLYFVMWKLDRIAKNELNKGQTTAFKRCSTASEAKRYRRTLHEFEQLQKKTELLNAETAAVGMGTIAVEKAKIVKELELAARKAGIELTPEVVANIQKEAEAYAAAKKALDEKKASMEAVKELQNFIGSGIASFFSDIVSGGKNASDAMMNLTKKLADAALQAALLGQGPLAKIFGMAGSGGGVGGVLGMIFGSIGFGGMRAAGGPVSSGRAYVVGEKRPELFIPTSSGRIVPKVPQGGSTYAPVYNIDARGADAAAVARIERSLDQRDRQFSQLTQSSNRMTQVRGVRP
jgi:hypothetical protein